MASRRFPRRLIIAIEVGDAPTYWVFWKLRLCGCFRQNVHLCPIASLHDLSYLWCRLPDRQHDAKLLVYRAIAILVCREMIGRRGHRAALHGPSDCATATFGTRTPIAESLGQWWSWRVRRSQSARLDRSPRFRIGRSPSAPAATRCRSCPILSADSSDRFPGFSTSHEDSPLLPGEDLVSHPRSMLPNSVALNTIICFLNETFAVGLRTPAKSWAAPSGRGWPITHVEVCTAEW